MEGQSVTEDLLKFNSWFGFQTSEVGSFSFIVQHFGQLLLNLNVLYKLNVIDWLNVTGSDLSVLGWSIPVEREWAIRRFITKRNLFFLGLSLCLDALFSSHFLRDIFLKLARPVSISGSNRHHAHLAG